MEGFSRCARRMVPGLRSRPGLEAGHGSPETWLMEVLGRDPSDEQDGRHQAAGRQTSRRSFARPSRSSRLEGGRERSLPGARAASPAEAPAVAPADVPRVATIALQPTTQDPSTDAPEPSPLALQPSNEIASERRGAALPSASSGGSPPPVRPAWLVDCHDQFPGAAVLRGAVPQSVDQVDDLLAAGYGKEERDMAALQRGFTTMAESPEDESAFTKVLQVSERLTNGEDPRISRCPLAVDTVMLAAVTAGRFLGAVADQGFPPLETRFLAAAAVNLATKSEETLVDSSNLLAALVRCVEPFDYAEALQRAKAEIIRVEFLVWQTLGFLLSSPTPVTFLHLYLARATSIAVMTADDTPWAGRSSCGLVKRFVRTGRLAVYRPSELAAVALYCAVLRLRGVEMAEAVAEGFRYDLGDSRFTPLFREAKVSPPRGTNLPVPATATPAVEGVGGVMDEEQDVDTEDVTPPPTCHEDDGPRTFFPDMEQQPLPEPHTRAGARSASEERSRSPSTPGRHLSPPTDQGLRDPLQATSPSSPCSTTLRVVVPPPPEHDGPAGCSTGDHSYNTSPSHSLGAVEAELHRSSGDSDTSIGGHHIGGVEHDTGSAPPSPIRTVSVASGPGHTDRDTPVGRDAATQTPHPVDVATQTTLPVVVGSGSSSSVRPAGVRSDVAETGGGRRREVVGLGGVSRETVRVARRQSLGPRTAVPLRGMHHVANTVGVRASRTSGQRLGGGEAGASTAVRATDVDASLEGHVVGMRGETRARPSFAVAAAALLVQEHDLTPAVCLTEQGLLVPHNAPRPVLRWRTPNVLVPC